MGRPSSFEYLPQRILGGVFRPEALEVNLRDRTEILPKNEIRMVCLGIIEEPLLDPPTPAYARVKEAIGKLFSFERKQKSQPLPRSREKVYLEMFVSGRDRPFRFDSESLNYRGFIPEVAYQSETNLKKFLGALQKELPDCKFDESFQAYVSNDKSNVKRYIGIYEFQRTCLDRWEKGG